MQFFPVIDVTANGLQRLKEYELKMARLYVAWKASVLKYRIESNRLKI